MLDDDAAHALVTEQFDTADNMTDSIGALAALRDSQSPVRDALFARFEARWRDEPLVLDKWFELQAQSARDDTLGVVRALLAHPRFNARNPNRVRSLVGAFTLRNFARFNASDGAGYAFAAEQVRALDAINPQLASAIAGAFNLWQPVRRAAAHADAARSATDRAHARPVTRRCRSRHANAGSLSPSSASSSRHADTARRSVGLERRLAMAVDPRCAGPLAGCSRRYQYVSSVMWPGSLRR